MNQLEVNLDRAETSLKVEKKFLKAVWYLQFFFCFLKYLSFILVIYTTTLWLTGFDTGYRDWIFNMIPLYYLDISLNYVSIAIIVIMFVLSFISILFDRACTEVIEEETIKSNCRTADIRPKVIIYKEKLDNMFLMKKKEFICIIETMIESRIFDEIEDGLNSILKGIKDPNYKISQYKKDVNWVHDKFYQFSPDFRKYKEKKLQLRCEKNKLTTLF